MGRLFDGVASLLGVCQQVSYEGQAAVELETLARSGRAYALDFGVMGGIIDPRPVVVGLVDGLRSGVDRADLAAGFHQAVIRATAGPQCTVLRRRSRRHRADRGVFVNRLLLHGLRASLNKSGYEVLTHRIVPCNDGGLALGQAAVVAALQVCRIEGTGKDWRMCLGIPGR